VISGLRGLQVNKDHKALKVYKDLKGFKGFKERRVLPV